ncbi:MAG: hypothetical protein RBS57_16470 [Desulforhabdus sp.]|jgi:hypothetical protein|nr:hypothetical protein [Desulforhabdus sp.]
MVHWIFIEEGTYPAEEAFLFTSGHTGMILENVLIEVYLNGANERRVRGQAFATNMSLVELLEDYDQIDMLVDLGGQFKYLLKNPTIRAGKVFAPDVKSIFHFMAQGPLEKLGEAEFSELRKHLSLLAS